MTALTLVNGQPPIVITAWPSNVAAGMAGDPAFTGKFSTIPVQRGLVVASTAYIPGDVVTMTDGRVVLIKTASTSGTGSSPFISAANYVIVGWQHLIFAAAFGLVCDALQSSAGANTTALQAALNAANPTGANAVGGVVVLPRGNFYTNAFIQIPNGVTLRGNSGFGTFWSLADDSNCSVVGPHVSSGSGNPNAFYWSLQDMYIDCRQSSQGSHAITDITITAGSTAISSTARPFVNGELIWGRGILPSTTISGAGGTGPFTATLSQPAEQTRTGDNIYAGIGTAIYGVHCNINPLTTQQTGDWGFDPSGYIHNVTVKNARDAAFANFGRSANVYMKCKCSNSAGIGFIASFDTRYVSCESDFSNWHGWDFRGSSCQMTNCKSYNSGNNSINNAHGFKFSGFANFGEIALTGCDAQQNTGDGFYLNACTGVAVSGCTVAYVGFTSGATTACGFRLVNSNNNVISGTVNGIVGTHALELISGSDKNDIRISHTGSLGAVVGTALTAGSALLTNAVVINGAVVNLPGLTSATQAYPQIYARNVAAGAAFSPGITGTAQAAVLNRMELVPLWVPRQGMTVKGMSLRVPSGSIATAVARQGIYTSDLTGGDTFQLLGELPLPHDCSAAAVLAQDFSSSLVIPGGVMLWLATVPQVALATFTNAFGNNVAGTSTTPNNGYAITTTGVSGALPATCVTAGSSPTVIGVGIAVTATLLG